jgi:hypothetical protein
MADRLLFISWGTPVRGREERALEVFNEAVGLYGRMQQQRRIESFSVVLLDPNGDLEGYIELEGTAAQLAEVRDDDEFRRILVDAALVVESLRLIDGFCNDGVARELGLFQEAVTRVPQRT